MSYYDPSPENGGNFGNFAFWFVIILAVCWAVTGFPSHPQSVPQLFTTQVKNGVTLQKPTYPLTQLRVDGATAGQTLVVGPDGTVTGGSATTATQIVPGSDAYAQALAIYNASPSCTDSNGFVYAHCGKAEEQAGGSFTWSAALSITSPYFSITGQNVQNHFAGTSGCLISVAPSTYTYGTNTALIGGDGFNIDANGNTSPNLGGVCIYKEQAPKVKVGIQNFAGTGDVCFSTFSGYTAGDTFVHNTERAHVEFSWSNCTTGFYETGSDLPTSTSGYGDYILDGTILAGQVGWKFDYVNFSVDNDQVHFICNVFDTGTCMSSNSAVWFHANFTMEMEQTGGTGGTARNLGSNFTFGGTGYLVIAGLTDTVVNDQSCVYFSSHPDMGAGAWVWRCNNTPISVTDGTNYTTIAPGYVYTQGLFSLVTTKPTGTCPSYLIYEWVLSKDGHIAFCDGTNWVSKL